MYFPRDPSTYVTGIMRNDGHHERVTAVDSIFLFSERSDEFEHHVEFLRMCMCVLVYLYGNILYTRVCVSCE